MTKQLMEVVLPRLARPLYKQLKRYRAGQLDDVQFTKGFESLLQQQHAWLSRRGVPEAKAALAIHGAVLILSGPGLVVRNLRNRDILYPPTQLPAEHPPTTKQAPVPPESGLQQAAGPLPKPDQS